MELFSLLAKLTLDKSEYEKSLDEAQKDANAFEMPEEPELTLDADGFSEGVSNAREQGKDFGSVMEGVFDGIKTALTVSGVVAAVSGIVGYLKEGVNLAMQLGDDVDKGSKRLNISTTAYQEWQHALSQSGANINDLNRGIRTMNQLLTSTDPGAVLQDAADAADGMATTVSKDAAQAFARLGISEKVANGELKTTEELMEATLIALAGFQGSKEERGTLVTALFGPNGNNLNALLDEGQDGVKDLLAEAGKLGLVMSEEEIAGAVQLGDNIANLKAELQAIQIAFVQDILPILNDATAWLTSFFQKFNPRLQTRSIDIIFDDIDRKTRAASMNIDASSATAKKLIDDLQHMGDYWTLDEQGRMTWDALAAKALELFPQLSEYIDTDGKKIKGNTEEIEKNIDAWARLEKQRLLSNAMSEKSEAVAEQLTKAYEKGAEAAEKEDDAYGKMAVIMDRLNGLLNQETTNVNVLAFQKQFREKFGDSFTAENFAEAAAWFKREYSPIDMTAKGLIGEWESLSDQASSLKKEADEMIASAEEANSKLDEYEARLAEQMGLTKEEVVKTKEQVDLYIDSLNKIPSDVWTTLHFDEDRGFGRAIGDRYIPYDNFPALLHRGERVLTATEARRERESDNISTNLENRIIAAIREGMAGAQVEAVVTDRELARGTNRFNGKEIDSGRFLP